MTSWDTLLPRASKQHIQSGKPQFQFLTFIQFHSLVLLIQREFILHFKSAIHCLRCFTSFEISELIVHDCLTGSVRCIFFSLHLRLLIGSLNLNAGFLYFSPQVSSLLFFSLLFGCCYYSAVITTSAVSFDATKWYLSET